MPLNVCWLIAAVRDGHDVPLSTRAAVCRQHQSLFSCYFKQDTPVHQRHYSQRDNSTKRSLGELASICVAIPLAAPPLGDITRHDGISSHPSITDPSRLELMLTRILQQTKHGVLDPGITSKRLRSVHVP